EESMELEHSISLLEPLAFALNILVEQLCTRLSARALATNELRLRFALDGSASDEICTDTLRKHGDTEKNSKNSHPERSEGPAVAKKTSVPPCLRGEKNFERNLHLPVPMLDARIFLKLLQLDLRLHPPGAPITKIWLGMQPVRPRGSQIGLFLPVSPEPERLELTLARVTHVVGSEEKVGSPK